MNYQHIWQRTTARYRLSTLLISGLALCILLLSACSSTVNTGNTSTTPTVQPTPAIDSTLHNHGDAQLQTFQQWISLVQKYNGKVSTYQQQYTGDQQALQNAKTSATYQAALSTLKTHVQAIQIPALKTEAQSLQQQLQQQATSWGKQHQYHDTYDNATYQLGYEYGPDGIGDWAQSDLSTAQTAADYQLAIEYLNKYLSNFQAMVTNSSDKTPYDQVHQTDLQLMQHFDITKSMVIVVSLSEQAMRIYDNGKLVRAFLVTTGRPTRPTPPGLWWVEGKQSPTVFKAGVPTTSPYYYPDTPINYAMQYHSGGYFLHDSWWRADYGPGTQFPHQDASGDVYSSQGSHGCVNLSKENAAWLYSQVVLYTHILVY